MSRTKYEHSLAVTEDSQNGGIKVLDERTDIPVVSILLYAHAAVGPEYAYPA
jgi:hypothetical protein